MSAWTRFKFHALMLIIFALGIFIGEPVVSVPAGHTAIVDWFGHVNEATLDSGVRLKSLLAKVTIFSLKTRLIETTLHVPTSEGLIVELDVSILYHLVPSFARSIYVTVGPDFEQVLLIPEITSTIRSLTASVVAKTLYSAGRDDISEGIKKQLNERLTSRGFQIEQALLRKAVLPALVTTAIEEKLKAEQESQRMEFILTKEKQEAERKRIEATGISDFQNIVSKGISRELLEWKGIDGRPAGLFSQYQNCRSWKFEEWPSSDPWGFFKCR